MVELGPPLLGSVSAGGEECGSRPQVLRLTLGAVLVQLGAQHGNARPAQRPGGGQQRLQLGQSTASAASRSCRS